jgi:hypothetical protein
MVPPQSPIRAVTDLGRKLAVAGGPLDKAGCCCRRLRAAPASISGGGDGRLRRAAALVETRVGAD